MKRILSFSICFIVLCSAVSVHGQGVGINESGTNPDPSAILDLSSTTKGTLITRMTTGQRDAIAAPAEGLQIFNTTTKCYQTYVYGVWQTMWCATCPTPDAPLAGTNSATQTQIVWNWNSVAGATGYKWNTTGNYPTATDNGNSVTYTQTGLSCNTAYTLYVWAYNSCGGFSAATSLTQSTANSSGGTASASPSSGNCGYTTTLSLSGYSGGTIQWQSSTDNITFTNISGATTTSYNTTVSNPTMYFKAIVTDGSCLPVASTTETVTASNCCTDAWTQRANFGGTARALATGFAINGKGYLGTGTYFSDFWEWDQTTNVWTQKANYGGGAVRACVGFAIGSKGYVGTGWDGGSYRKDFWEYNPATNSWTQRSDFPGLAREGAAGFAIGTKGYIGGGAGCCAPYIDFYEFDPSNGVNGTWTQRANFAGNPAMRQAAFSIGSIGYMGLGYDFVNPYFQTIWAYDPSNNTWTQKANFPGAGRWGAATFTIASKAYLGTGNNGGNLQDFWVYDPSTGPNGTWTQKANFGGAARSFAVAFAIGTKGYLGTGNPDSRDFWEYCP